MVKVPETETEYGERRELIPVATTIKEDDYERIVKLHSGLTYTLQDYEILEDVSSVQEKLGMSAALVAEISLGRDYHLLLFDRGENSQGSEEPLMGKRTSYKVTDRFLVTDMNFLLRANINQDNSFENMQGFMELCAGTQTTFGRGYDHDGRFDIATMPMTVSEKHFTLSIDFDDSLYIIDNCSTNGTYVHYARTNQAN